MIVYSATNTATGKRYIGLTTMLLSKRRAQHLRMARLRPRTIFAKALRSYGPQVFVWEELFRADDFEMLALAEQEAIRVFKAQDRAHGYNMASGGEGNRHPHTPATRARIAASLTGKKRSIKVPLAALPEILARRARGDSYRSIGADYGVRAETIFYFVKRHAGGV